MIKANLSVPVVTLSIKDNIKLLQQSKSGFSGTINRNNYLSRVKELAQNPYLDIFISPNYQGEDKLFVLLFEDEEGRERFRGYYFPVVKIKDYKFKVDRRNFFDQLLEII